MRLKLNFILFLFLFHFSFLSQLSDIQVNGGNYGSHTGSQHYFNIDIRNQIPLKGEILVDLEINGIIKTIKCVAVSNKRLKCILEKADYTDGDSIFIVPKSSENSSAGWINIKNTEEKVQLNFIKLNFMGAYEKKNVNTTHSQFKILTNGNSLPTGTKIYVRIIYLDSTGNTIDTKIVPCLSEDEFLQCVTEIISGAVDFNLNLPSSSSEMVSYENVIWTYTSSSSTTGGSSVNQHKIPVYNSGGLSLNFDVNSFSYNSNSSCYEFSFKDDNYNSGDTFFVTDIIIGNRNLYAYCNYINNQFYCRTKNIEYSDDSEIKIPKKSSNYGTITWSNVEENHNIKNLIFPNISQVYNLTYDNNKWKFYIKIRETFPTDKTYKLDVKIGSYNGLANCNFNNGMFVCEVDSAEQTAGSLISLRDYRNGDIKFFNLYNYYSNINYYYYYYSSNYFIPLNIELEFKKSYITTDYYSSYSYRFFTIDAKFRDGITTPTIPTESIFTVDVKKDDVKTIAYCKLDSNNGNNIGLSCMVEINSNEKLKMSNYKSQYTSITWINTIVEEEMFLYGELFAQKVYNLKYDTSKRKYSFDIYVSGSYTKNSKLLIDLKMNGDIETTATCIFTTTNILNCVPNINDQQLNDNFEIVKNRKDGTITFTNANSENLIIYSYAKLTFEKAYDLIYDNDHWNFTLKVSNNNLAPNKIIKVCTNYYIPAKCETKDDNTLKCKSLDTQEKGTTMYLKNNCYGDEYVKWTNLNSEKPIYVNLNIKLKNTFGCYIDYQWKYNIDYEYTNDGLNKNTYYHNYVLLDILVNNNPTTERCEISENNILKCSNSYNKNDKIEISGNTSPYLGTVILNEISTTSSKLITPAPLTISNIQSIDSQLYCYGHSLNFILKGKYPVGYTINKAAENTELEISIKKSNGIVSSRASCSINYYDYYDYNLKLNCKVDYSVKRYENTTIKVNNTGYSKNVKFDGITSQNLIINTNRDLDYDYYEHDCDYIDDCHEYGKCGGEGEENKATDSIDIPCEDDECIKSNIGTIVGGVVGGVAGVASIGAVIYIIRAARIMN